MADTMDSNSRSPAANALRARLRKLSQVSREALRNPTTLGGLLIILLLIALAVFAPYITEANQPDPYQMPRDFTAINVPPGSPDHLLGTTNVGGDVFYGVIWGARTSVRLSVSVIALAVTFGVAVGSVAGFLGGRIDEILMRGVDVFMAIPELILALAVAAALGPSLRNIIIALALVVWVRYARIIRGQIVHIKQNEYVDAARVIGDSGPRIYFKDILPNSLTPIVVQATLDMGRIVLFGATLSFIGLSEAGIAEWGVLVSEGQSGIGSGRWWASTFPGAMIFLWALAFNLAGDGLRDVLDPKTETT